MCSPARSQHRLAMACAMFPPRLGRGDDRMASLRIDAITTFFFRDDGFGDAPSREAIVKALAEEPALMASYDLQQGRPALWDAALDEVSAIASVVPAQALALRRAPPHAPRRWPQ